VKQGRASIAGAVLVVSAWLTAAGCLNPRPEELPSERGSGLDSGESETFDPGAPPAPLVPGDGLGTSEDSTPMPPSSGAEAPPADAGAPDAGARARQTGVDPEPPPETEAIDPRE
jgi:hypothetical protein